MSMPLDQLDACIVTCVAVDLLSLLCQLTAAMPQQQLGRLIKVTAHMSTFDAGLEAIEPVFGCMRMARQNIACFPVCLILGLKLSWPHCHSGIIILNNGQSSARQHRAVLIMMMPALTCCKLAV